LRNIGGHEQRNQGIVHNWFGPFPVSDLRVWLWVSWCGISLQVPTSSRIESWGDVGKGFESLFTDLLHTRLSPYVSGGKKHGL
jgi:hypothetical protein